MAFSNFPVILPWVLAHEGGYVNHPDDPGGATNRGIIQRTYDAWLAGKGQSSRSVRNITEQEVREIYREQYWNAVRGDGLPAGLDYTMMDYGVNSGPRRAIKELQRELGVKVDGWFGVNTMAAVKSVNDVADLIIRMNERRMRFLRRLKHFKTFGRGWTRRVMGERDGVQQSDHGTIDRSILLHKQVRASTITPPSVRDDGAHVKAEGGDRSVTSTLIDAAKDKGAVGVVGGVTAGVSALTNVEGPIAYALAAVLVIGAVGAVVWFVRQQERYT